MPPLLVNGSDGWRQLWMRGKEDAWRGRADCRLTGRMRKAATDVCLVEMEKFERLAGMERQG